MDEQKTEEQGVLGYCVKCRAKRSFKAETLNLVKEKRAMLKGNCSVCDTKMCRILSKKDLEEQTSKSAFFIEKEIAMELKIRISVDLINIKTGKIILSDKSKTFDFMDENQLIKTLTEVHKSIHEMQLAEQIQQKDNEQWRDK